MVQFRKSKKIGPIRLSASKGGLGISAGAGPLRVSRGADGKVRRTVTIPGTGLSDTQVVGGGSVQSGRPAERGHPSSAPSPTPEPASSPLGTPAPSVRAHPVTLTAPLVAKGYNGVVEFDGATVQFHRKGLSAKIGGLSAVSIPITSVCAVEWKEPTAMVNGHLHLVVPLMDGNLPTATPIPQNSHAVLVTKQQRRKFDEVLAALNVAMRQE